jgi:hypothetical protein
VVAVVAALIATLITQGFGRPASMRADERPRFEGAHDRAAESTPIDPPRPLEPPGGAAAPAEEKPPAGVPPTAPGRPDVRFEGVASPGLPVILHAGGAGASDHLRWIQTHGPAVILDDPTSPSPRFVVPEGVGNLGFLLVLTNAAGTETAPLEVPIVGRPNAPGDPGLRPDAGDDQIGIVGRQITLSGMASQPRGEIGYRWVQVSGPKVRLEIAEGGIYSFVPQAPGIYVFALLIARDSQISEPDYVTVSVGNPTSAYGIEPTPEPPQAIHDVARASLGAVPGGLESAEPLAEAFDGIADRMDLYRSYAEAYSELSRRLEPLVPADPTRRAVWDERLFVPLTAKLIDGLRAEGLDLRQPESRSAELTSGQRARFAEMFRSMARGFRATRPQP